MNLDFLKNFNEINGENDGQEKNSEKNTFIIDTKFDHNTEPITQGIAVKKETARSKIAYLYVSSFLAIIFVIFVYSIIRRLEINNVKDLLVTVSGILSGPLGFIIGYYFKVEDEQNK